MNNTTTLFKLQHPEDLISRLFILEYVRELGVEKIREKLIEGETKFWLYSFEGDNSETQYDFNWEYLLFVIPLSNLSHIMERYLDEVEEIEKKRQSQYKKLIQEKYEQEAAEPAEINLYDYAKADIEQKNNPSNLIIPN